MYLSNNSIHKDLDFAGLVEKARFSFLPLSPASRYGINRLIDSRNCYELIRMGFVIPTSYQHEHFRTVEEIVTKDKGRMIFSPQIGLHENVVVLDYENEYANLILRHNLSYETETGKERAVQNEKDLLPTTIEKVLDRRMLFKNLQKKMLVDTKDWHLCEQRIAALKSILVCLYGTTGSLWNRLANVTAFEEINRLSREVLIKPKMWCKHMVSN